MKFFAFLTTFACVVALAACGGSAKTASPAPAPQTVAADFDADSAYAAVKAQTDMGPRTPGSAAHARCADWIAASLTRYGADTVIRQRPEVTGPDGRPAKIDNIMGRFNAAAPARILIAAHYDTRPVADNDPDPANHSKPIDGANDGASGVGVIMELARQIGLKNPAVGVDFLLVDLEDSGNEGENESWAIGTQYWAAHTPYTADNRPRFAIVLDMVGGSGAVFTREAMSMQIAPSVVAKVWAAAQSLGHGNRFVNRDGGGVVDDHIFISRAGIPAIDIIECSNPATGSFPPAWHTMADNISVIDRDVLGAVGQTVATVIYNEKP